MAESGYRMSEAEPKPEGYENRAQKKKREEQEKKDRDNPKTLSEGYSPVSLVEMSPEEQAANRFFHQAMEGQNRGLDQQRSLGLGQGARNFASTFGSARGITAPQALREAANAQLQQQSNVIAQDLGNRFQGQLAGSAGLQRGAMTRDQLAMNTLLANEKQRLNRDLGQAEVDMNQAQIDEKKSAAWKQMLGTLLSTAGATAPYWGPLLTSSDRRMKDDIKKVGESPDGLNIYRFKYKGEKKEYEGVLAQELLKTNPEAVGILPNGYYGVRYDLIDVNFGEANG